MKLTVEKSTGRQMSLLSFLTTAPRSLPKKTSRKTNTSISSTPKQTSTSRPGRVTPETKESSAKVHDPKNCLDNCSDNLEAAVFSPLQQDASVASSGDNMGLLSDYELLRLRNIERNNARLAALGLLKEDENGSDINHVKPPPRRKRPISRPSQPLPVRRSTRRQRTLDTDKQQESMEHVTTDTSTATEDPPVDIQESYTVSPLLQYTMTPVGDACDCVTTNVKSLSPTKTRLVPPSRLGAIYSLQFFHNTSWLVGAGKSGVIAVWNASAKPENDTVDPILCWKAHGGRWIAEARFLPSHHQVPSRLLTAANDGAVCLWDLSTVSTQEAIPKLLMRTGKELHASGIFALDVQSSQGTELVFATASKDKTVRISTLDADIGWWTSQHHSAKVGDVRFRGEASSLLASVGDDGLVVIHDFKSHRIVAESSHAHSRPHSIVWNPTHEHVFMTGMSCGHGHGYGYSSPHLLLTYCAFLSSAGHDKTIKLWDLRRFGNHSCPLGILEGHVPVHETKCKKIHRPIFYNPCGHSNFVLTGGQNSNSLSMFRCSGLEHAPLDVSLCSRGKLPLDCGDAGCIAVDNNRVAVATDQAEVLLLRPSRSDETSQGTTLFL